MSTTPPSPLPVAILAGEFATATRVSSDTGASRGQLAAQLDYFASDFLSRFRIVVFGASLESR